MVVFCSSQEFYSLYHDLLNKTSSLYLQVRGGSMYPFIRGGDWIEIRPLRDKTNLEKGEIILFRRDDSFYVHRVIKKAGDNFITKGDLWADIDGSIPPEDILARVIAIERKGRRRYLYSKLNRLTGIFMANFCVFLPYLFRPLAKLIDLVKPKPSCFREDKFLMLLLKEKKDTDSLKEIISADLDWSYILKRAQKEGIFYPVYRELTRLDAKKALIPEERSCKFKESHYLYISEGACQAREITRILDYINSLKIRVLLLKGISIDPLIYRDDFFRPRLDLDLVGRNEDIAALGSALVELGYLPSEEEKNYPLPEYLNSQVFINNTISLSVHLHRHIINNLYLSVGDRVELDMEKVWSETEPFKSYSYIFTLRPELQIIYLAEHGLKHNYEQMIFLYELSKVIDYYKDRLNWGRLIFLAREFNLERALYWGLYLVKEILTTDIPEDLLNLLKPVRITMGEKIFIRSILNKRPLRESGYAIYLAVHKGLLKKIVFLFRTIFPPKFTLAGYGRRLSRLILP